MFTYGELVTLSVVTDAIATSPKNKTSTIQNEVAWLWKFIKRSLPFLKLYQPPWEEICINKLKNIQILTLKYLDFFFTQ